jgi:F-type H+-transporting ATPase subunit delta
MAALGGSVARRYARALFDLGVAKGNFEALGKELENLARLYDESRELRQTLENPVFKNSQKRKIVEALLPQVAQNQSVRNFALLLVDRGRINVLPMIARAYQEMTDKQLGQVRATVTSAKPLDMQTETEIQRALERRTGKKVLMKSEVDPTLIGGVVARVGDLVLDGSLRTRLASVGNRILLN